MQDAVKSGSDRLGEGSPKDRHHLQLFDSDGYLATEISRVLCVALDQGHAAIAITTPSHQRLIDAQLKSRGVSLSAVRSASRYASFDARELLDRFVVDGAPDEKLFRALMRAIIGPMSSRFGRVSVFGEMVALLWSDGRQEAAIALEKLWNKVLDEHPVLLYCGYPRAATEPEHAEAFREVCAEHCRVLQAGHRPPTSG